MGLTDWYSHNLVLLVRHFSLLKFEVNFSFRKQVSPPTAPPSSPAVVGSYEEGIEGEYAGRASRDLARQEPENISPAVTRRSREMIVGWDHLALATSGPARQAQVRDNRGREMGEEGETWWRRRRNRQGAQGLQTRGITQLQGAISAQSERHVWAERSADDPPDG